MGEVDNNILLNNTPDKTIYWTGESVPELGIFRGMLYNDVISNLIKSYLELKNATINIGALSGKPEVNVSRDEAISAMSQKMLNLSTSDIKHDGIPFTYNRLSVDASKFLGSKFSYSVETDSNGSKLGINLKEGLTGDVLSSRVIVSGKSTNGKNVVMDSSEKVTSVSIKNEMYPINIDILSRVQTKGGIVDLTKQIVLRNPSESGSFESLYDVKDRSFSSPFSGNLSDLLGGMEATQDRLEQYHDVLKNTSEGDIVNRVSSNEHKIASIDEMVKSNETVEISLAGSSGTVTTKTVTPQKAINSLTETVNKLLGDSTQLKSDIAGVQNKVGNISNPTGGGIPGTTSENLTSASNGAA